MKTQTSFAVNAAELPTTFGRASLVIDRSDPDPAHPLPLLKGASIILPARRLQEFFTLQKGRQFVARLHSPHYGDDEHWFGGTDESSAFLTRVDPRAFQAFKADGEPAFYQALKPNLIRNLEELCGVSAVRQGDFYAVPIGFSLKQLRIAGGICYSFGHDFCLSSVKRFPLFKTRHRLTGEMTTIPLSTSNCCIGQGVLEASDHAPVTLTGLHYIVGPIFGHGVD